MPSLDFFTGWNSYAGSRYAWSTNTSLWANTLMEDIRQIEQLQSLQSASSSSRATSHPAAKHRHHRRRRHPANRTNFFEEKKPEVKNPTPKSTNPQSFLLAELLNLRRLWRG